MTPAHVNPMQWHQSVGYARQVCARVFRDGGRPEDALRAFGLARAAVASRGHGRIDWSRAVTLIAEAMCAQADRRAA